jgi:hypothetical protein
MNQRTVIQRARSAVRAGVQCSENAFPLTFLALAFGLVAGIAAAGIVIPEVVQIVARAVRGA